MNRRLPMQCACGSQNRLRHAPSWHSPPPKQLPHHHIRAAQRRAQPPPCQLPPGRRCCRLRRDKSPQARHVVRADDVGAEVEHHLCLHQITVVRRPDPQQLPRARLFEADARPEHRSTAACHCLHASAGWQETGLLRCSTQPHLQLRNLFGACTVPDAVLRNVRGRFETWTTERNIKEPRLPLLRGVQGPPEAHAPALHVRTLYEPLRRRQLSGPRVQLVQPPDDCAAAPVPRLGIRGSDSTSWARTRPRLAMPNMARCP